MTTFMMIRGAGVLLGLIVAPIVIWYERRK